jgi:hypothetical protein
MLKIKHSKIINSMTIIDTAVTIAGIILIGIGLYKIYPPAMYIIIGIILAFPGIPRKAVK